MADKSDSAMDWEEVDVSETGNVDDEGGLSLEELDDAVLGDPPGDDPYAQTEEDEQTDPALIALVDSAEARAAKMGTDRSGNEQGTGSGSAAKQNVEVRISPRTILEAILFVGTPEGVPQTSQEIARLMRGVRSDEIEDLIDELNQAYTDRQAAFRIESTGGGYRMRLHEEMQSVREKFYGRIKEARLSQAAVDVMAIVAYRQPVTRDEIDHLRGKPSGPLLNQLVRRELVSIELTAERPRRRRYRTTDRFLSLFGIQSLGELPQSQEIDIDQ